MGLCGVFLIDLGWDQMTIPWDCDVENLVYIKAGESWPSEIAFSQNAW